MMRSAKNKNKRRSAAHSKKEAPVKSFPKVNSRKPALFIGILSILLYLNTLNHGFVLDDNSAIENNWLVKKGISAVPELFSTSYRYGFWKGEDELYRPLPLSVFAIMWQSFPGNPMPFHLLLILLYAITSGLLFIVLRKILSTYNILIPFIASVIFVVHPVHTEVVANIKSADEILSLLFILLSVIFIYRYTLKRNLLPLILSAGCYFLSLLAKESAIAMLMIIPMTLYFFTSSKPKDLFKITSVLFSVVVAYFIIRTGVLGSPASAKHFAFVDNVLYSAPDLPTRWATAFSILFKYIFILFIPATLSSDYTFPQIVLNGWNDPLAILSLLLHAGLFIYALVNFKKRKLTVYIILFYLLSMALYSNLFVLIGSPFAERFLFVPSIAFGLFIAWLLLYINRIPQKNTNDSFSLFAKKALLTVPLFLIIAAMSYKTIARNKDWKSNYTLFRADATNSPKSARMHYFYANEIRKEKAMKAANQEEKNKYLYESITEYNRSIALYPEYGDPYGQMGMSYFRLGDRKKALELYQKAISLSTTSSTVYNNMGVLFSESGRHSVALEYYKKAVFYDPYYFDGWKNLGNTYAELGRHEESIEAFSNALKYKDEAEVNYFMGIGLELLGRKAEANAYFEKAYSQNPAYQRPN